MKCEFLFEAFGIILRRKRGYTPDQILHVCKAMGA